MEREKLFDSLKIVLIFLVVYGHVIQRQLDTQFNLAVFNFIYMFHMPLFVFISGRYSHIYDRGKYKERIIRLLETYFVFQTIRSLLGHESIYEFVVMPNGVLWYLLALVYWRIIIYFAPLFLERNKKYVIAISFFCSILSGFIPIGYEFTLQRFFAFSIFFFLGYYSRGVNIENCVSRIPLMVSILFLSVSFLALYVYNKPLSFMHHCASMFWSDNIVKTLSNFGARCLFVLWAPLLSVMIIRLIALKPLFAKYGKATLFILVIHPYIINCLYFIIKDGIAPSNGVFLFLYAIIITVLLTILTLFINVEYILNPLSTSYRLFFKVRNKK